jgi:hypothetical protein
MIAFTAMELESIQKKLLLVSSTRTAAALRNMRVPNSYEGRKKFMILILVLCLVVGWSSSLFAQTPFYQGKTITIVVGTKAGDVYDLYPRLLAEFWTKNIPGNPNIIVQNVPGAASLIAANQVYNLAKPDGLTLAAIYPALYFDQLIQETGSKIRLGKMELDRQSGNFESFAVHARRHALQHP